MADEESVVLKVLKIVVLLLLSPLILGVILFALALWFVCTITCFGPLLNYLFNSCEEEEYEQLPADMKLLTTPQGYRLAIRFSDWATIESKRKGRSEKEPLLSSSNKFSASVSGHRRNYPVIIPNGLAATLGTTARIHDGLAEAGFQVISFDRYGVGASDENTTNCSPTVDECVRDMLFVMNALLPQQDRFILLGPSMGAIVAQCFIAQHPDKVAGFMNMDGFPAAFENKRDKFLSASGLWNFVGYLTYTGVMRFLLRFMPFDGFATPTFPTGFIRYQMNKPRFYFNTKLEFPLMLDLASYATKAWGSLAVNSLEPDLVEALVRAKPEQYGSFVNGEWRTLPRSSVEHGTDWNTLEQTAELVRSLQAKPKSQLASVWQRLAVRVMNGRDYSYAGGDSFYDNEMKDKAAAEGELQVLLAGDGARYAFPQVGHDKMFMEFDAIVQSTIEIDNVAPRLLSDNIEV